MSHPTKIYIELEITDSESSGYSSSHEAPCNHDVLLLVCAVFRNQSPGFRVLKLNLSRKHADYAMPILNIQDHVLISHLENRLHIID